MAWQTLSVHFKQSYDGGYRYLDRCGEFMLAATEKLDLIPGQISPNGAQMELPEQGIQVNCDSVNLAVMQELPTEDTALFLNLCKGLSNLVAEHFQPKGIVKNGFAWKSFWAFQQPEEMFAATLKLGGGYHSELGKLLGIVPEYKNLDCMFASGSKGYHVVLQPTTFEKVSVTKQSATFQATKSEKNRIDRRNKFADRVRNIMSHALILEVDVVEEDPPQSLSLEKHFAELERMSNMLRNIFLVK